MSLGIPERQLSPPEPSLDDFLAEHEARLQRAHEQDRIVRLVLNGSDDSFYGQSEHGDALMGVIRRLQQMPLDDARKWRTLQAALKGLASEWASFQTGEK